MLRHAARSLCLGIALLPVLAPAESPPAQAPAPQASIPFANHGGIRNWKADGTRGLWVQDNANRWYYATLLGPCSGLDFAHALLFDTGPDGALDVHSAIRLRDGPSVNQYCPFKSFVASEGPPPKKKRKEAVQKPAGEAAPGTPG